MTTPTRTSPPADGNTITFTYTAAAGGIQRRRRSRPGRLDRTSQDQIRPRLHDTSAGTLGVAGCTITVPS